MVLGKFIRCLTGWRNVIFPVREIIVSGRRAGPRFNQFNSNKEGSLVSTYITDEHHRPFKLGWTQFLALCLVSYQARKRRRTTVRCDSDANDVYAQDDEGQTALHDAISDCNCEEVKRLLENGAHVNITDRFGNTPLHFWRGHLDSGLRDTIIAGMRNPRQQNIFGRMSPLFWWQEKFQDYMGNTALHLVCERYLIDGLQAGKAVRDFVLLNATDSDFEVRNCFGETPHLSVFTAYLRGSTPFKHELPECMKKSIETTDRCGRTILHRICMDSAFVWTKHAVGKLEWVEALKDKMDMYGRIPLHYAAMRESCHCDVYDKGFSVIFRYCNTCMKRLSDSYRNLSSIRDVYGRTAWHYAGMNRIYFDSLSLSREKRKAASIPSHLVVGDLPDIDGITPKQMSEVKHDIFDDYFHTSEWKKKKHQFHVTSLDTSRRRKFTESRIQDYGDEYQGLLPVCEMLKGQLGKYLTAYADRNELTPHVNNAVTQFMERLIAAIDREDERLQCDLLQVGSSFEGTKVDLPDEFDFNIRLKMFGEICEVTSPPQKHPPGFVVLRRRQATWLWKPNDEYTEFFNDDHSLNVRKLNFVFQRAVKKVLCSREFNSSEPFIEIICDGNVPEVRPSRFCMPVIVRFKRAICGKPVLFDVKIDIVPAIHINGWWPAKARKINQLSTDKRTKAELRSEGCNFVFDQPYKKYDVPYSDTQYVKISFARAESILLRNGLPVIRDALMLAKHICTFAEHLNFSIDSRSTWSHALKSAALYYAFETRKTQKHLHLRELIEELFLQLYRFTKHDFVPSFFLPTLHTKVWDTEPWVHYSREVLRERHKTYMELFENGIKEDDKDAASLKEIRDSLLYSYFLYRMVSRKETDCVKWKYPKL